MTRTVIAFAIVLTFTIAFWAGEIAQVTAAEPECPSGEEWTACRAQQGDPLAMYVMGRDAYEKGRESGDMTAALDWALKIIQAGNKNGERLLKMVYLQLSWGTHRDLVQAYVWLSQGIANGGDYLVTLRKNLTEKMSAEQLAQARKLAQD